MNDQTSSAYDFGFASQTPCAAYRAEKNVGDVHWASPCGAHCMAKGLRRMTLGLLRKHLAPPTRQKKRR